MIPSAEHNFEKKTRVLYILFIIGSVILILHAWYYYPFIADDSFISYRYAERLLNGSGLSWNNGKPVEGYSNLLWILLLAGIEKITHAEWWIIAMVLNLIFSLGTLFLLLVFMNRITDGNMPTVAIACLCFVISPPVAIWINGGLEAPLTMFLLWLAITTLLKTSTKYKDFFLAGVYLGLLSITRPDGVLFVFILAIGLTFYHVLLRNSLFTLFKPLLFCIGIALFFYTGQLIFRLNYYGEWIPNTALVKIGFSWHRIKEGFVYTSEMLCVYMPFIIISLLQLKRMELKFKAVILFIIVVIFFNTAYITGIGGDIFPGFRFSLPLIPLLSIVVALCMTMLRNKIQVVTSSNNYLIALTMLILAIFIIQSHLSINYRTKYETWEWNCMAIGNTLRTGFSKINLPLIATTTAGALPFYSKMPALDMLGLNDYYLAHHRPSDFGHGYLAHELGDAGYYMQQKPDIIIFSSSDFSEPVLKPEIELFKKKEFRYAYAAVKLRYKLDYKLPFPMGNKWPRYNIRLDEYATIYVRISSNKTGIYQYTDNEYILPVYFVKSEIFPDSPRVTYLGKTGNFVTDIGANETVFIPANLCHNISLLTVNKIIPVKTLTESGNSLSVTRFADRIRIYNPNRTTETLVRLLIITR